MEINGVQARLAPAQEILIKHLKPQIISAEYGQET